MFKSGGSGHTTATAIKIAFNNSIHFEDYKV